MASPPTPPARPPPIRGGSGRGFSIDPNLAAKAIDTVKAALPLFTVGPPIIRTGPAGDIHADVPVMYMDFAIDRVHYDPYTKSPSPKGRPVRAWGVRVDPEEARSAVQAAIKEAWVVEAVEFRDPEDAWAVPVAWGRLIIMHVKVSYDGRELIPDYGLTEEVRRYAL